MQIQEFTQATRGWFWNQDIVKQFPAVLDREPKIDDRNNIISGPDIFKYKDSNMLKWDLDALKYAINKWHQYKAKAS